MPMSARTRGSAVTDVLPRHLPISPSTDPADAISRDREISATSPISLLQLGAAESAAHRRNGSRPGRDDRRVHRRRTRTRECRGFVRCERSYTSGRHDRSRSAPEDARGHAAGPVEACRRVSPAHREPRDPEDPEFTRDVGALRAAIAAAARSVSLAARLHVRARAIAGEGVASGERELERSAAIDGRGGAGVPRGVVDPRKGRNPTRVDRARERAAVRRCGGIRGGPPLTLDRDRMSKGPVGRVGKFSGSWWITRPSGPLWSERPRRRPALVRGHDGDLAGRGHPPVSDRVERRQQGTLNPLVESSNLSWLTGGDRADQRDDVHYIGGERRARARLNVAASVWGHHRREIATSEIVSGFLLKLAAEGRSPATIAWYRARLDRFVSFVHDAPASSLSAANIRSWLLAVKQGTGAPDHPSVSDG